MHKPGQNLKEDNRNLENYYKINASLVKRYKFNEKITKNRIINFLK
jgi:hypothetical protein